MSSPSIIKTFARIHPDRPGPEYAIDETAISLQLPDPFNSHLRQMLYHRFQFDHVFGGDATQDEVFDVAAKEVVSGFLAGYNGTIFAYGQTGSGKTFSMHGSATRYKNRGIAPRALSMIYSSLEQRDGEVDHTVRVSFMEIYQEVGYDLLSASTGRNGSFNVPQFPKVGVFEGVDGGCLVRNLSNHLAANEDVAQTLLLQGEANRRITETPQNARSSRSHAVFTINLTTTKRDSDINVKSKLHLVDLAGSERCAKTGADGPQLAEAKCINLSLHHLEGVIIGLQHDAGHKNIIGPWAKSKIHNFLRPYDIHTRRLARPHTSGGRIRTSPSNRHIPYRNSLLTMLLKDSLGGNCLTAMIATINTAPVNIHETISTCRFAQRVACVKNMARKNEEVDDKAMVKHLRTQVEKLEAEIMMLRNGEILDRSNDLLNQIEREHCHTLMQRYVGGIVSDPVKEGINSLAKFRLCLHILKTMMTEHVCSLEPEDDIIIPMSSSATKKCDMTSSSLINRGKENWESIDFFAAPNMLSPSGKADILTLVNDVRSESAATNVFLTASQNDAEVKRNVTDSKQSLTVEEKIMEATQKSPHAVSTPPRDRQTNDNDVTGRNAVVRQIPEERKCHVKTRSMTRGSNTSLDQVMDHVVKDRYRSPYEKRQERQAQKLHERVEKLTHESATLDIDIETRRQQIRQEQLFVLKRELEHKLYQSRQQLSEQGVLIQRLEVEQPDSDILANEHLARNSLLHRISKIEKRLRAVEHKMNRPSPAVGTAPEPITIEEKFPRFVKQHGGLYASNLIDLLQAEEKVKRKHQMKLATKRITTMAMELEVKEMATRQRLREFKEKLRLFRENKGIWENERDKNSFNSKETIRNSSISQLETTEKQRDHISSAANSISAETVQIKTENENHIAIVLKHSLSLQDCKQEAWSDTSIMNELGKITLSPAEKPFETYFSRNGDYGGELADMETSPVEPLTSSTVTAAAKGYSSALVNGNTDDAYSHFQRPKFQRMSKRIEFFQRKNGVSHVIPDVNLTGSKNSIGLENGLPVRTLRPSIEILPDCGVENPDAEEFIKKLQGLKLEQAFAETPTLEFSKPELDSKHLKSPRKACSGILEITPALEFSKTELDSKHLESPKSFREKQLRELSKKLSQNLSSLDGNLLNTSANTKPVKETFSKLLEDSISRDSSPSCSKSFITVVERPSSLPAKPTVTSTKQTRRDRPRPAICTAKEKPTLDSSATYQLHSKSEFKIDWKKDLVHINSRPVKSDEQNTFPTRMTTSDARHRSEIELNSVDLLSSDKKQYKSISIFQLEENKRDGNDILLQESGAKGNVVGRSVELKNEANFLKLAREQKERVKRLRRAQESAEIIQRAWRKYRRRFSRQAVEK